MGCWLFPINSKSYCLYFLNIAGDTNISHFFEWVVDWSPLIQKVIICTFWILQLNGDTNITHFFEWVVDWSPLIQKLLFVLSEYWYWMKIQKYLIILEYLLVLIVDVWTSKIVNWFNIFWGNEWPHDYYCWKYEYS